MSECGGPFGVSWLNPLFLSGRRLAWKEGAAIPRPSLYQDGASMVNTTNLFPILLVVLVLSGQLLLL